MSDFKGVRSYYFSFFDADCRELVERMKKEFIENTHHDDESLTMRVAVGCKGLPASSFVNLISAVLADGSPDVVYQQACEFVADAVCCVKDGEYD